MIIVRTVWTRKLAKILPETELYAKTGIQKQIFNTIYQLMAVKQKEPELLQRAKTLLMLPDYFGFRLTGNKLSEYTNGSTTQLVNPNTFQWDTDLIRKLGYPEDIFLPLTDARNKSRAVASGDPEGSWFQSGSGIVRKP